MRLSLSLVLNFRTALVAVASVAAAAGCSDPVQPAGTSGGSGSTTGGDAAVNLGDGKSTTDATKDGTTPATDTDIGTVADADEVLTDAAVGGCTKDEDCKIDSLGACERAVCDTATGTCKVGPKEDGQACDDGNACTESQACTGGVCADGKPKDCNDNNPCTDNKCDKTTGCVATNNTAYCDDGNPCTAEDTCADGACKSGTNTCNPNETNCGDGKDDDGDGQTDCGDNDCANAKECANLGSEKNCTDKIDDDKDGSTDCTDSDCAQDAACLKPVSEGNCTDKIDDDGDSQIDCADNDCATDPACLQPIKEANCVDQIDDDKDGSVDCADSDCAQDAACKTVPKELDCKNTKDDDTDGLTDCADNDCSLEPACAVTQTTEKFCANKLDDDKDGALDCADSDCKNDAACKVTAKESDCKNAKDDDGDTFVDCKDSDCLADAACKSTCDVCKESATGLKVGCDPCVEALCKADEYCCTTAWDDVCIGEVATICKKQCTAPKVETLCADKVDNDGDGQTDCTDADCVADAGCKGKETKCADKLDDDKDGMTDCADADCKVDLACQATACVDDFAVVCGGAEKNNNSAVGSTKSLSGYTCKDGNANGETGPEYTYAITAECDGPLTVTVVKQSTKAGFLDLFLLDATKGCVSSACVAHALMSGSQATKTIPAKKGEKYFAVIDGYQGYTADFSLKVACGCAGGKELQCTDKLDNDSDGAIDCKDADCAADLACAPTVETACTDKIDNDKDGKVDCADADCAASLACAATATETLCADQIDNDGDKLVDCNDNDCAANLACSATTTESNCVNKVDDDKDGKIDCADTDCAKDMACTVTATESNCVNKVDDDKDGKIDCADSDCAKDLACSVTATETKCADKLDDDKDGKIDCADSDCAKDVACAPKVEILCGDKLDNDGDKLTDCADPDCSGLGACICKPDYPLGCGSQDSWSNTGFGSTKAVSTYVCSDGTVGSETGGEYTYGYTANCDGELTVSLTKSTAGLGFLDLFVLDAGKNCGSNACIGHALMSGSTATKTVPIKNGQKYNIVVDGYQNFGGNYSIKATCKCGGTPTIETKCADKLDDDKDGKTDCADSDCAKDVACTAPTTELVCADKLDNDKDGQTDCADTDCAKDPACVTPLTETKCADKLDDDKDGKTDCADSDCVGKTGCICQKDFTAVCAGSDSFTNAGAGSTKAVSAYTCADGAQGSETGPEYTYEYVAACDGAVTATLTKTSQTAGYLDLFVLDGAKVCGGGSCLQHALMTGTTAKLTFQAKKGAKYNLVVDGYNNYSGNYIIKFACACQPTTETKCADKLDDDKDGKTDCADTDCAKDPACAVPVAQCEPDFTLTCGATDNYGNGNFGSTKVINAWTCADGNATNYAGPEYTYDYTATCTGPVKVTVKRSGALSTGYLDLFILDGSKTCSATTCTAHALMIGDTTTKTFTATKGNKYFLVVDGYAGADEDYQISVDCTQCK
ncbi:MAG: hypothetical protein EXR77_04110 [Myxococcales bacterium]|nr:hypothetical protein [Myxococcales bacterium]